MVNLLELSMITVSSWGTCTTDVHTAALDSNWLLPVLGLSLSGHVTKPLGP